MNLLKIVALLLTISRASAFYLRRLRNDTLQQQQENEAAVYSRIYNGHPATHVGQFPYQVGLQILTHRGIDTCGGSLISRKYVLTAAHCTNYGLGIFVYLGALDFRRAEIEYDISMDKVIKHDDYVINVRKYDIAVIKIPKVKSDTIKIIKLPPRSDNLPSYADAPTVLAGWGATSDSPKDEPPGLMYATFKVITNEKCAETFGKAIDITKLCTDASDSSGCVGDSGSPLALVDENEHKTQIGILSASGLKCAFHQPNVFTSIDFYLKWIIGNTDLVG